jgi:oxygen-dependent protoporphyrinogen oxidase
LRVVIVGGGLSGLFTASELMAAGVDDVVVVDAANHPGGLTRTIEKGGYSLEPAAGSFSLPHPALSPIIDRCGIEVEPAHDASTRYVFIDGRLVPIRPGLPAHFAPLMSVTAKASALAEPLRRRSAAGPEESLAGFLRRRFGSDAGNLIGWLMASGVYAGDPEQLSAEASFPILSTLEREHGSIMLGGLRARRTRSSQTRPRPHVPGGGMTALVETLAASLQGRFRGFSVRRSSLPMSWCSPCVLRSVRNCWVMVSGTGRPEPRRDLCWSSASVEAATHYPGALECLSAPTRDCSPEARSSSPHTPRLEPRVARGWPR